MKKKNKKPSMQDYLNLQVSELKKQLIMKDALISSLREQIETIKNQQTPVIPGITTPYIAFNVDMCPSGGLHDYPTPWFATIPPSCKKCGKLAPTQTVTCETVDLINYQIPNTTAKINA